MEETHVGPLGSVLEHPETVECGCDPDVHEIMSGFVPIRRIVIHRSMGTPSGPIPTETAAEG